MLQSKDLIAGILIGAIMAAPVVGVFTLKAVSDTNRKAFEMIGKLSNSYSERMQDIAVALHQCSTPYKADGVTVLLEDENDPKGKRMLRFKSTLPNRTDGAWAEKDIVLDQKTARDLVWGLLMIGGEVRFERKAPNGSESHENASGSLREGADDTPPQTEGKAPQNANAEV